MTESQKKNELNKLKNDEKHDHCYMRETCLKDDLCPLMLSHMLLTGKRKILILWFLSNKVLRFSEILHRMPDVTKKMLTKQLRDLESDHLIERHVYATVPPKVEYSITEMGKKIIPIMEDMHQFGADYIAKYRDEVEHKKHDTEAAEICQPEDA